MELQKHFCRWKSKTYWKNKDTKYVEPTLQLNYLIQHPRFATLFAKWVVLSGYWRKNNWLTYTSGHLMRTQVDSFDEIKTLNNVSWAFPGFEALCRFIVLEISLSTWHSTILKRNGVPAARRFRLKAMDAHYVNHGLHAFQVQRSTEYKWRTAAHNFIY